MSDQDIIDAIKGLESTISGLEGLINDLKDEIIKLHQKIDEEVLPEIKLAAGEAAGAMGMAYELHEKLGFED